MSSCGWVVASPPRRRGRHRTGDVGLTASAMTQECTQIGGNGPSMSFWGICVHCWAVALGCGWPWDHNSVHKWEDRAPPRRIGAFVYTVGLREDRASDRGDAVVYTDRPKWPLGAVSGHLCTLLRRESRYESRRELPASGGTSASAATVCRRRPLAGPSRLVGKTGSERVAPLPGWRLRRGINPHEPPKSQIIWESPDSPRWFQKMTTKILFGSVAVRTSNAVQPTQGVC